MARQCLLKLLRVTSFQILCNISKKKWEMNLIFIAMSITIFKWYYYFWWVWPDIPNVLKISMQCLLQYPKNELSYEADVLHADRQKSLLQVDKIIFDGFGLGCPKCQVKFAMSLWHLKKEDRNEVTDLTALPGSKAGLTIHYTFNVLPPLTLFFSYYGIHAKPFLHLIVCITSSFLLFQVMIDPCKLACLFRIWVLAIF